MHISWFSFGADFLHLIYAGHNKLLGLGAVSLTLCLMMMSNAHFIFHCPLIRFSILHEDESRFHQSCGKKDYCFRASRCTCEGSIYRYVYRINTTCVFHTGACHIVYLSVFIMQCFNVGIVSLLSDCSLSPSRRFLLSKPSLRSLLDDK